MEIFGIGFFFCMFVLLLFSPAGPGVIILAAAGLLQWSLGAAYALPFLVGTFYVYIQWLKQRSG